MVQIDASDWTFICAVIVCVCELSTQADIIIFTKRGSDFFVKGGSTTVSHENVLQILKFKKKRENFHFNNQLQTRGQGNRCNRDNCPVLFLEICFPYRTTQY